MRGVGHEPSLLLQGTSQPFEQVIECAREIAELIARIQHRQALVQILRAHARGLFAHGHHRSEALARQKIAAEAGDDQRNRNYQEQRFAHILNQQALRFDRLHGHDADRRAAHVALQDARAETLPSQHEVLQSARRSGGARDQMVQNFAGNFRLRASSSLRLSSSREMAANFGGDLRWRGGLGWILGHRQRLVFGQYVAGGIEHREAMIA